MKPLVDCDMLVYQVGFGTQYIDEGGEQVVKPFDAVIEHLDQILTEILEESWSDEDPVLYLTGDRKLLPQINKQRKRSGEPPIEFKPNFREAVATSQVYKGNRTAAKPVHYDNIRSYLLGSFDCKVAWGLEADDLISIDHRRDPEGTIICSRDKDLKITPGNHYGWACHNQESFGPIKIDKLGFFEKHEKKYIGGGLKFFYSQMLMGDSVDNIPGIPGKGPAFAYKNLADCRDEEELSAIVSMVYEQYAGDTWKDYFLEQANLLWMIQELDADGNPVMFKPVWER